MGKRCCVRLLDNEQEEAPGAARNHGPTEQRVRRTCTSTWFDEGTDHISFHFPCGIARGAIWLRVRLQQRCSMHCAVQLRARGKTRMKKMEQPCQAVLSSLSYLLTYCSEGVMVAWWVPGVKGVEGLARKVEDEDVLHVRRHILCARWSGIGCVRGTVMVAVWGGWGSSVGWQRQARHL